MLSRRSYSRIGLLPSAHPTTAVTMALQARARATSTALPAREIIARPLAIGAGVVLLPLIAVIDFVTGFEINFFVFYFLPIALLAWFGNRTAGLMMGCACAAVWYWVDVLGGPIYSTAAIGLWNAALRLISFALIALLVSALRAHRDRQAELNKRLNETVAELEESLDRIRRLQNELQVVCAWTHRIHSDGKWIRFEDFLQSNLGIRVSHGISGEAVHEMRKHINESDAG